MGARYGSGAFTGGAFGSTKLTGMAFGRAKVWPVAPPQPVLPDPAQVRSFFRFHWVKSNGSSGQAEHEDDISISRSRRTGVTMLVTAQTPASGSNGWLYDELTYQWSLLAGSEGALGNSPNPNTALILPQNIIGPRITLILRLNAWGRGRVAANGFADHETYALFINDGVS